MDFADWQFLEWMLAGCDTRVGGQAHQASGISIRRNGAKVVSRHCHHDAAAARICTPAANCSVSPTGMKYPLALAASAHHMLLLS